VLETGNVPLKIALLTTDNRDHYGEYAEPMPQFGAAPEALLAGFARQLGVEVHVIACARQRLVPSVQLAPQVFFHSLFVPRFNRLRSLYAGGVLAVRRKLRELQPDLVHGQGTERDCALAAVFSGFPNVVTIHGNMARLARLQRARVGSFPWLTARLEDFTLPRTWGVFCNSTHTETLVRPRARRIWHVPNALREVFFASLPATPPETNCPVLLNVGVICANKRQLDLLTQAEHWYRAGLRFELQFIGRADARVAGVNEFLARVKAAERLGFARYRGIQSGPAMVQCLDQAAALIHVADEEAFGLVVAEALARNVKLFAFRTGGVPEIAEGRTGAELFVPGDWSGLGNALSRWIREGGERPAAATLMRQRYHPDVIVARHLEIYREVLRTIS